MSKFHPLTVATVERDTRDAIVVTFDVPPSLREQFRYSHGQHLTLRALIDGQDLRRSYSICAAAHDRTLRIAVKRAPGGTFSTWINEALKAGAIIDVMPPMGHFTMTIVPDAEHQYVAFAAGSGITPILSIIKTTLAMEPRTTFTLFYGNRASSTVMFREELAALKDVYLTRFNLVHVLSREAQDIDLLHGRIDRQKAGALLDRWVRLDAVDAVFVCGPEGMMEEVIAALKERRYPDDKIKIERFAASIPKHRHVARPLPSAAQSQCEVTVVIDGARKSFLLEKEKENIIEAGIKNGVELPYSCRGGVCSTCRCRLIEGEVDMDVNFALEDYEVARGFILSCQSYPTSDKVVVDYDQTGSG